MVPAGGGKHGGLSGWIIVCMDWWNWGLRDAGLWWLMIFHRSYAVVGEDADTVFFR